MRTLHLQRPTTNVQNFTFYDKQSINLCSCVLLMEKSVKFIFNANPCRNSVAFYFGCLLLTTLHRYGLYRIIIIIITGCSVLWKANFRVLNTLACRHFVLSRQEFVSDLVLHFLRKTRQYQEILSVLFLNFLFVFGYRVLDKNVKNR